MYHLNRFSALQRRSAICAACGLVGLDIERREVDHRNVTGHTKRELVVRSTWLINKPQEIIVLTDIFAFRYANNKIWDTYSTKEKRLLVQAFSVVKDMNPYYDYKGREDPVAKATWKNLHDRISVELGLQQLSQAAFSYQTMHQGKQSNWSYLHTWLTVCENWLVQSPGGNEDVDAFVKERLSLIEVAMRDRELAVSKANSELPQKILDAKRRPSGGLRLPGDLEDGIRARNKKKNESFQVRVDELNTRFRQAGCKLHYHNGFIQISEDELLLREAEEPFWKLVSDTMWKNVDTDMKEAIDRRDGGERDPAWYAARALESTIKIISDEKGWSHGREKGAHNYIDNLAKKDALFIERWESDALKSIFTELRNPFGHGPGSAEMPSLTPQQIDLAIELCISWAKSLIKRF